MSLQFPPDGRAPSERDDVGEMVPETEPKGELTPPPRKPPTAVAADAAEPEPRPPHSVQRWRRPSGIGVPRGVVEVVDAVLDVLDSIGDTVRTAAARITR